MSGLFGAIEKLITTEIKPAVQTFKNKLNTIDESLFGAIAKGVIGAVGGSSGVSGARNAAPYIAALLAVAEKGELLKRFENRTITLAAIGARRFGEGGPTDNIPRLGMIPYE